MEDGAQALQRWCHTGVWERLFEALAADRDNQYLMIDSTIVRAHQQAASGKGGKDQALGRSRGGLTTKIHMLVDALGQPLRFIVMPGQAGDITQAPALLQGSTAMPSWPTEPMTAMPCGKPRQHGSRSSHPVKPFAQNHHSTR